MFKKNLISIIILLFISTILNAGNDIKQDNIQDVLKNKITEIDFMNGKIVQFAEELNCNVPFNKIITYLIKGLEKSYVWA